MSIFRRKIKEKTSGLDKLKEEPIFHKKKPGLSRIKVEDSNKESVSMKKGSKDSKTWDKSMMKMVKPCNKSREEWPNKKISSGKG